MSNIGRIDACLHTDTGQVRDHNEDFVEWREPTTLDEEVQNGWLYIVADGVGGADAGEVASAYATERTIFHYFDNADRSDWGQRLIDAMFGANRDLRQFIVDRNDNSRMATTMVTAVIQENHLFIGNVGDSRGYHWRQGYFQQVTKDHSLVAKLLEEGAITPEEAKNHPHGNVILHSLGSEDSPRIDLFDLTWEPGDVLLLCSDGLTGHVEDDELGQIISTQSAQKAAQTLISLANERGGKDNISVAIVKYMMPKMDKVVRVGGKGGVTAVSPSQRTLLWLFTLVLSITQSLLIFLAWFYLRV